MEILNRDLPELASNDGSVRAVVIGKALDILSGIHSAFTTPANDQEEHLRLSQGVEDPSLEDAKRRRVLHALLDLISLEGIYPSLSSGIGIPLQQRVISVLPAGVIAKQSNIPLNESPHDEGLLNNILFIISSIVVDTRPSIQSVVRGRILSDIISGALDLSHNSKEISIERKSYYQDIISKVIEAYVYTTDNVLYILNRCRTPSSILLPTLSSFLQTETAPWFKTKISSYISRVPLRQEGVLQTILFVTSQFAPTLGREAQDQASNGPHFTVQAIMHVSRLLSSVPQYMDPVVYFSTIAPQLLALIDGDDPDLKKTASYVVGNGILGKRAYGAPGTIGHSIFVEPLFKVLTADLDTSSQHLLGISDVSKNGSSAQLLVNESTLALAISRLKSLALQHPNPGLVKRLVYPILVPLWGLASFTQEIQQGVIHKDSMALLQTYFGVSVGIDPLKKLVNHLLWNGGPTWTYKLSEGRTTLVRRDSSHLDQLNVIHLMDSLQSRIELFVNLLGSDPSSEERTGDIFLYVSETWLVKHSYSQSSLHQLQLPSETDESDIILQKLVSTKLAEKLLHDFKDSLSRRPLQVLELIKQIIDGELNRVPTGLRAQEPGGVSLSSLSNIVNREDEHAETPNEQESAESLSTAFSLLSTVLASPEFVVSYETRPILEVIKTQLDQLTPRLPSSLAKPGTTSSMLLEIHLASPDEATTKNKSTNISDLDTHRQALTNLNSDLPPVQAEGFSLLSDLIKKSSPVLDIPSTLSLLVSVITDSSETSASEEFIYLNAIKLIGTLASRHPRTVVKTLVDRYADKDERATLDQRLKIGEALLRTVQDLGKYFTGETSKILGDGMIAVAGRRGHKPQAQNSRRQQLEKEKRAEEREIRRKERENAMPEGWSITSPIATAQNELDKHLRDDDEEDTETPEQATQSANILSAWAAGALSDEEPDDLRVRASAISILASAVQTNLIGLGPSIASSAVDLALATVTLEPDPESAILRRASVVILLDILKALDTARETRGSDGLGFGFSLSDDTSRTDGAGASGRGSATIGSLPRMLRALHFVEGRETDGISRGHLRVLIESLEAWMEKSLLWGIGAKGRQDEEDEPRLELGDRIAGLSVDPLAGRDAGPKIEEID